jgi:hypothetical protein
VSTHEIAIFCKSFRDDFDRLQLLIRSVEEQDIDTPLLISVPESDLSSLEAMTGKGRGIHLVADESYVIPGEPFEYGWLQQQICKLSVHLTGFAKSYVMIDSDTYFISGIERTIAQCQKEQIVASAIFTKFYAENETLIGYVKGDEPAPLLRLTGDLDGFDRRLSALDAVMDELLTRSPDQRGCLINELFGVPKAAFQPSQLFHARMLQGFSDFLAERGMDFYSCIKLSPWEYNWYACFAVAKWQTEIMGACSPVLHFASEADVLAAKDLGLTESDFKKHFVAIQMAARHFDGRRF